MIYYFQTKNLYAFLRVTYLVNLFVLVTLISGDEYKVWSPSLYNFCLNINDHRITWRCLSSALLSRVVWFKFTDVSQAAISVLASVRIWNLRITWSSVLLLGYDATLAELAQSLVSASPVTFRSGRIAPWGFGKQQPCKSAAAGVWNGKY
jgi:hypothetical protein